MSASNTSKTPYEIIEQEKDAYLEGLSEADPEWPPDVRVVYSKLRDHLFRAGLEVQNIVEDSGIGSHDIYGRFRHYTGYGIKEFAVYHRLELAKYLLSRGSFSITQVAFSLGYASTSGFCATFRRHEGCSPTEFQDKEN